MNDRLIGIKDVGPELGVSRSTVWRLIQRGELPSIRKGGRRLIPASALGTEARRKQTQGIPAFRQDHPMFRLAGAGRSGGAKPGAREKYAILERP